eukprot:3047993-Pyramimonas_sp.AAC.1
MQYQSFVIDDDSFDCEINLFFDGCRFLGSEGISASRNSFRQGKGGGGGGEGEGGAVGVSPRTEERYLK